MNIGTIIRTKRRAKDLTQEELAELLSVSVSAVSQWELGKTLPDIALVPAICTVLGVSADELFSIDEEKKEAEINEIVSEARKAGDRGYSEEALAVIEAGLKRYPDSWLLWHQAMHYHYILRHMDDHGEKAIEFGERILAKCTDPGVRGSATQILCFLYSEKNPERAEELLKTMDGIYVSREVLSVHTLRGDKKLDAVQSLEMTVLDFLTSEMRLNFKLDSGEERYTRDELAKINEKAVALYHTVFEDGDFGFYHTRLEDCESYLAYYYAEKKDAKETLVHLEREAYHAVEFVKFEKYGENEYENTSLALRGHKSGGFSTNSSENNALAVLNSMSHPRYDFIRETPEFAGITAKLAPYAGDWAKRE